MGQATYRQRIVQRQGHRQRRLQAVMRTEAVRLARLAAARFELRRLYLFGSVARGSRLSAWSDIDLAVEGLPTEDYWSLVGMLAAAAKYPVDVKPLEDIVPSGREEIRARGIVLYERQ